MSQTIKRSTAIVKLFISIRHNIGIVEYLTNQHGDYIDYEELVFIASGVSLEMLKLLIDKAIETDEDFDEIDDVCEPGNCIRDAAEAGVLPIVKFFIKECDCTDYDDYIELAKLNDRQNVVEYLETLFT